MKKRFVASLLLLSLLIPFALSFTSCSGKKERFSTYSFDYFDTVTSVTGYEKSKEDFDKVSNRILAQLEEYHRLYTTYDRYDGLNNLHSINTVNNGAHSILKVDQRIIDMLLFSKELYEKTEGKVNIAMGSVLSIWHDYRSNGIKDPINASLPPMETLLAAAEHTDIEKMIIDDENDTVFLSDPEMLLDVGAIAKGYAVERIAESLSADGIEGYVLNVGGNVRTIGKRDGGEEWTVGIEDPDGTDENPYFATLEISDLSLVTSGSYQRFYIVGGKNYNHIIDPDTLMPSERFVSVSIVCKSSALADALSTALFSMSVEDGQKLLAQFDNVHAMWVLNNREIKYSSGFSSFLTK